MKACIPYLLLNLCVACMPKMDDDRSTDTSGSEDIDGDGWTVEDGDCWEDSTQPSWVEGALEHALTSADIYPGAPDAWYDGIDANCDGVDDFDQDGDGFVPTEYEGVETLGLVGTGLLSGGDCQDEDASIHPAAEEVPMDGIDGNCDELELCLRDQDADGYSDGELVETVDFSCEGYGLTLLDGDCDVANPNIHPGAEEACDGVDSNCDGTVPDDELDIDGDGYVACALESEWLGETTPVGGLDCDDDNPEYYVEQLYYSDSDGDGYGVANGLETLRCGPDFTYTALEAGDCAPSDPDIHPNAIETNDGVDDNCDGMEVSGYSLCEGAQIGDAYFMNCGYPMFQMDAQTLCVQHGYDGLASVLNQDENDHILALGQFLSNGLWLSATDIRSENSFTWAEGGPLQYNNWYGNHPNVAGLQASCVSMEFSGLWKEVSCDQALTGVVCMRRGVPVPE